MTPLPTVTGGYGAFLADPPWRFATYSAKGRDRCPETRHYETMTLEQIKALPVADIAAPDSVLLLWAIDPMLPHALETGTAWGFTYKTVGYYWVKPGLNGTYPIGTGYWTRTNPEQCLLFTRGKPRRKSASVRKLILSPRREHSRKPDEAAERTTKLVQGPYLELFARQRRPGWDAWGDEVDRFQPAEAA